MFLKIKKFLKKHQEKIALFLLIKIVFIICFFKLDKTENFQSTTTITYSNNGAWGWKGVEEDDCHPANPVINSDRGICINEVNVKKKVGYLEMKLEKPYRLDTLLIQGRGNGDQWVSTAKILALDDESGEFYTVYEEVEANIDNDTVVVIPLNYIKTSTVRIYPLTFHNYPSLRAAVQVYEPTILDDIPPHYKNLGIALLVGIVLFIMSR